MNRFKHNKVAQLLFDFCYKGAMFLNKHKALYYILMFTWGLLTSVIGLLVTFVLSVCADKKLIKYDKVWYFKVAKNWGGVSLGCMFIRDTTSIDTIQPHEDGHTYQNALLGPLFIFLVAIPSTIRYWIQRIRIKQGKRNKPYDSIWFEDNATAIGQDIM